MSIISDQTQGREEGTCAESERKEGKWEEKTAGYIAVPGTQGERCGSRRLRGVRLNHGHLNFRSTAVPKGGSVRALRQGALNWGAFLVVRTSLASSKR